MSDSKRHPFSEKFWKNFEHFFGGSLPDIPHDRAHDPEWVSGYVQDVMRQAFPRGTTGGPDIGGTRNGGPYRTEVFETHNSVVVKFHVPDRKRAAELIVSAGVRQVKLESGEGREQSVRLASHVVPESCKAVYRSGILQLHLRKAKVSDRMHTVFIQFKD